ncbi:MAG: lysophospholipid acyltransferase family protein [Synechococcus sp.]
MPLNLQDALPLTPATIARAREGVAAARNPVIRKTIQETRSRLAKATDREVPKHLSGTIRRVILRTLIHSLFDISVENREALPNDAAIIVSNHLNHFDALILLAEIPAQPFYYILGDARTLFNRWWKRCILHFAGGVIPVDRLWGEERAVLEAVSGTTENPARLSDLARLAAMVEKDVPTGRSLRAIKQIGLAVRTILARGEGVLVFAEGRLGRREGKLHLPLKRGTALYALRAGVPIVPITLTGVRDLYFRKKLTVRIGKPLFVEKSERPKREDIDALLLKVEHSLGELMSVDYCEPRGLKLFRYCLNHLLY